MNGPRTSTAAGPGTVELSFVDLRGRRHLWRAEPGPARPRPASAVSTRPVRSACGRQAVLLWVPAALASQLPEACTELENEVRVAHRLLDRFAGGHPAEIAEVIGHDLDAPEPFVLVEPPRGRPVLEVAGRLGVADRDGFERGLFRALCCLAAVGMVHGDLTPLSVRWDVASRSVQIRDFAHAAATGEPVAARPPAAIPGWSHPPVERLASPATDVWAAGQLVLHVATGQADPAGLEHRGAALRALLDGVFDASAPARPDARAVLRRLSARPPVPAPPTESAERFEAGRRLFDTIMAARAAGRPAACLSPGRRALLSLVGAGLAVLALIAFVAVWGGPS